MRKKLKYFNNFPKFLSFKTKVNPNENKTKSDIFSMGHIKILCYIFFIKIIKVTGKNHPQINF